MPSDAPPGMNAPAEANAAPVAIVSHNTAPEDPERSRRDLQDRVVEVGGRGGLEPTRYGDWEKNGRCIDF